jgi:hypothetical protein
MTDGGVDLSVQEEEPNVTLPSVPDNHEIKLVFVVGWKLRIRKLEPHLQHEVKKEAIAGW